MSEKIRSWGTLAPSGVIRLNLVLRWSFVNTKQGHLKSDSPSEFGDQWTFVALDVPSRAVVFHLIGKRDQGTTRPTPDTW